ncbi:cation channel sperm-associated protein subunit gamma isoform X3 [Dermochelys coriacea]|uniref:cation channel sperm-associated protein subunit gamma isoform X3 n=1 Tax=Dermochelys coriacea TaxID=27794 RepID=UPI001CAA23BF|nr:cation channel sperm-associated protein subunit gamma isoform X3 [Dermochelys coriacea]
MQNMQHRFALLVLLHMQVCQLLKDCEWKVVLNDFDNLGGDQAVFFRQHPVTSVASVFQNLTDSAIDLNDKNSHYLGFPYYLKINLTCLTQDAVKVIRKAHLTGLRPIVTVRFEASVNPEHQKPEQLQIEMKGAPYRLQGPCASEEVCQMCWYTPMPMMKRSVMMEVLVESNGLGLEVDSKRFLMNINGYMKKTETGLQSSLGDKVAIDSCWIGSLNCPLYMFSSSIYDAIAMESVLFIRQNQLVYYFTGNYSVLSPRVPGSSLWTRVLNDICVSQLNPVHFPHNGSEYVIAVGGGMHEGEFFLGTIRDGVVQFPESHARGRKTVCEYLKISCTILWAIYITEEEKIVLLVEETKKNESSYYIVAYDQVNAAFRMLYHLPRFIPKDTEKGFVMLLGLEEYTDSLLIPRGLSYNPFSTIFYIWGNVVLQSYDLVNYILLSGFPQESPISYFILSYVGEVVFVTDSEEIWFSVEGSSVVSRLHPSEAWDMYLSLQLMRESKDFSLNESFVSLFFNKEGLQQLVYIMDGQGEGKLIKRNFPLHYILSYQLLIVNQYRSVYFHNAQNIRFIHPCSFSVMHLVDLPAPQRFTRMEHYCTEPPDVMDSTGFHNNMSLVVYQGLIFQLLWLHADYSRPYADPVHDPTWRWWKNRKKYAEYFFYVASNGNSSGGVYVNMESYLKIYDLQPNNELPSKIYLDKNNVYSFSVFLSIKLTRESRREMLEENSLDFVWLTIVLAHPKFVVSNLHRHYLIGRGSILYTVTISDTGQYAKQELSGTNLLKSSMALKVINAGTNCYQYTVSGPKLQGYAMVPILIGCPPGKRLAFDITRTLRYTTKQNKRYFDCTHKNPELPCFSFSDVFYPFFLIQDMVTGDSGPFMGSYVLRIIGGGPYSESRIHIYSPSEILDYNTKNGSTPQSLIWMRANRTKPPLTNSEGFDIFSGTDGGIKWVCEQNSPCYDVVPLELTAPDYFFLVEVSNRAVDNSTYCDYDLEFVIHIHGLRLSPSRAITFMKISMAILTSIVVLYILHQVLGPMIWAGFTRLIQRVEEAIAVWTATARGTPNTCPPCRPTSAATATCPGAAWKNWPPSVLSSPSRVHACIQTCLSSPQSQQPERPYTFLLCSLRLARTIVTKLALLGGFSWLKQRGSGLSTAALEQTIVSQNCKDLNPRGIGLNASARLRPVENGGWYSIIGLPQFN